MKNLENIFCRWFGRNADKQTNIILNRMLEMEHRIMEAIDKFAADVNTAFDNIGTTVDGLTTSLEGVTGDVTYLKKQVADLQNTPPTWTPEDQAKLDAIQARVAAIGTKLTYTGTKLADLDAATENPPAPPAA